jgi:hypothetical protein
MILDRAAAARDTAMVQSVILNGFQSEICERILQRAFAPFRLTYCLRLGLRWEHIPSLPAQELAFYHRDMKEEEEGIDWNAVRPLDEALVEEMRECEAVFLAMMTRFEKTRLISYQERKRRYLRQLRYWNHLLLEKKIDLFLSNDIPHEGYDFVLYCLCKKYGIPTLMFYEAGPIPDLLFLEEDWEKSVEDVRTVYEKLRTSKPDGSAVPLAAKFEEYFRRQTRPGEPDPWYLPNQRKIPEPSLPRRVIERLTEGPSTFVRSARSFLASVRDPSYWSRQAFLARRARAWKEACAFYDAHVTEPDLTKRFLYVPLHMQPESSSCPMCGAYTDQQLVLQMLSSLAPSDVLLYVKEHPNQGAKGRDIALYQDLLALPNVRFMPRNVSTFRLMEACVAVATGTGGAAFEAPFRGKPVLMFGHDFEQYGPGVYPIHAVEDCRKALHAILVEGARPTPGEVRLFLRALQDVGIEGYVNPFYQRVTRIPDPENVARVGDALQARLKAIFPEDS